MGASVLTGPVVTLVAARAALAGSLWLGVFGLVVRLAPHHAGTVAAVVLVGWAVQGVFALGGGQLADRLPRAVVMLLGGAGTAVAWVVALAWPNPVVAAVTAAALTGVAGGLFVPAATALTRELVPAHQLRRLNAILAVATLLTGAVAGFLGGLLGGFLTWAAPVVLAAITAATATVLTLCLHNGHPRPPSKEEIAEPPKSRARDWGWPWMWVLVAQFGVVAVLPEVPSFAGGLPAGVSSVAGVGVVGTVVGSVGALLGAAVLVWAPVRFPVRAAVGAAFGFVPALVIAGVGGPGWVLVAGLGVAAVCGSVFEVLWDTALQLHVPERLVGRVSGFRLFGSQVVAVLVVALAAQATQALLVLAAIGLLANAATLLIPSVRRLPATRTVQEAETVTEPG